MSTAFGLYGAANFAASTRIAAGHSVALTAPQWTGERAVFRHSFWLPVPALPGALALSLGVAQLQARFAPLRLALGFSRTDWFGPAAPAARGGRRLKMRLPLPVLQFRGGSAQFNRYRYTLHRADGEHVAEDAAASGTTGEDLAEPWIGADFEVVTGAMLVVAELQRAVQVQARPALRAQAPALATGVEVHDSVLAVEAEALSQQFAVLSQLVVDGRPTSPRLRLIAERAGGDELLWQALQPGDAGTTTLPAEPLADAWAPALERLQRLLGEDDPPLRLRLDCESDAPCSLSLPSLSLRLDAELALLPAPARLDFDGHGHQHHLVPLALPAGGVPQALTLSGRVVADAAAAASAGGSDGRQGALLGSAAAEGTWQQALDLPAGRLGGVAIAWQPMSATVTLHWRLLSEDGAVLLAQTVTLPTPSGGWLALRCAPLDLQAGRTWLAVTLSEGTGVWLFGHSGPAGRHAAVAGGVGQALPQPLAVQALAGGADLPAGSRAITVAVGPQVVATSLAPGPLSLDLAAPALAALAGHPLALSAGIAASVTLDAARLRLRLP